MQSGRKQKIVLSIIFAVTLLTFVWYKFIVMGDFHPSSVHTLQEYTENDPSGTNAPQQEDSSDTAPAKSAYSIHINLDELTMYVYKNGELLKTYPVSGGTANTPSPTGTWKVVTKDTWGEGFGGAWLGINVPWGEYGIHGTPYPWFVGRSNSSRGCIRMLTKDAKELYSLIPYGTVVTIVHNNCPFRTMQDGDVGSDVLEMQKALKKLSYYQGHPDGVFGSILKNGVINFQKDNRLNVTGKINKQTYNLILEKAKLTDEQPVQQ